MLPQGTAAWFGAVAAEQGKKHGIYKASYAEPSADVRQGMKLYVFTWSARVCFCNWWLRVGRTFSTVPEGGRHLPKIHQWTKSCAPFGPCHWSAMLRGRRNCPSRTMTWMTPPKGLSLSDSPNNLKRRDLVSAVLLHRGRVLDFLTARPRES